MVQREQEGTPPPSLARRLLVAALVALAGIVSTSGALQLMQHQRLGKVQAAFDESVRDAARSLQLALETESRTSDAPPLEEIVRRVFGPPSEYDPRFTVWEGGTNAEPRALYSHQTPELSREASWNGQGAAPSIRGVRARRIDVTWNDRSLAVVGTPTPALRADRSWAARFSLVGGTLSSILLAVVIFLLGGRSARLQRAVAEKTAAVRASEARYRAIVEDQTELVCRYRGDCILTFVNSAYARVWEKTPEALIGTSWLDLVPPSAREAMRQVPLRLTPESPTHVAELEIVTSTGETRWEQWVDRALLDPAGRIVEYQSVGRDITERKRAEDALTRERAILRSLIDSIPDLIFFKDHESVYLGCNHAFAAYAGRSEDALIGLTDLEMFPREVAEAYRNNDRIMMSTGQPRRNEEWIEYPDGRRVLLDTMKTPFNGPDGTVLGLIGISRDITQAREAERALREAHRKLLTVREEERRRVAEELHEVVCQDLAALRLSLQTLGAGQSGNFTKEQTTAGINRAVESCRAILEVIRQICYALYPPQLEPLGLNAALQALPAAASPSGERVRVNVVCDTELPRFPAHVELSLFRVVQEAITNAARHGTTEIRVRVEHRDARVRLVVEDNGHGFNVEAPPSGLGLSLMRERMTALGGTLDISSSPRGTRLVASAPIPPSSEGR